MEHKHPEQVRSLRRRAGMTFLPALAAIVFISGAGALAGDPPPPPRPRPFDSVLSRVVATLISTQHYAKRPLDDSVSQQLFDEYLNALDRERRFFLASDIEEFSSERKLLDNQIYAGEVEFAFKVYERFLTRVEERTAYARRCLAEPFDFTIDEEVELDRAKSPWCQTVEEQDDVWRKMLKNRLLVFTLMEEGTGADKNKEGDENKDADKNQASGEDDPAAPQAEDGGGKMPLVRKTPVERVLDAQERSLVYLRENESIDVVEIYLSSLTRIYDPHSSYMAPNTEEDFDINMKLSLEGIGAVLSSEDGYVKIMDVMEGGPTACDGRIKPGDSIVGVAQEHGEAVDIVDMPLRKVVRMIRGPKGSKVYLSVIEAGKAMGSVPTVIDIVRDEVKLTDKGAKSERREIGLPDGPDAAGDGQGRKADILVLTLPSFYSDFQGKREGDENYRSASRDVKALLEQAVADGVDGVVLDLRSNGGGSLEEAISLAGLFIPEGPVVQVQPVGRRKEVHADKDGKTSFDGPLVILVNRLSASASEIVAAAMQDHNRAVIVGDAATHGKGTVQTVYDLKRLFARDPVFRNEETGALKFTIAKFYRVNGESTQQKGVVPDVVFPAFTDHMDIGEATLDHALRWDEIEPLEISDEIDVTPYLPVLKTRAETRLAKDAEFAKYKESVDLYGQMRSRKTTSLNLEKRRELQKQEEKWLAEIRQQNFRQESDYEDDTDEPATGKDKAAGKAPDLVLDHSLAILGDLIWLQAGDLLADPNAKLGADAGHKTGAAAAEVGVGKPTVE